MYNKEYDGIPQIIYAVSYKVEGFDHISGQKRTFVQTRPFGTLRSARGFLTSQKDKGIAVQEYVLKGEQA